MSKNIKGFSVNRPFAGPVSEVIQRYNIFRPNASFQGIIFHPQLKKISLVLAQVLSQLSQITDNSYKNEKTTMNNGDAKLVNNILYYNINFHLRVYDFDFSLTVICDL